MPPPTDPTSTAALDRASLNTQVIAELAKASVPKHELVRLPEGGAPFLLFPQDKTVKNLEGALATPSRKRGTAQLVDADSFASYVNAHRTLGAVIYGDANEQGGGFVALLDYHRPNEEVAAPDEKTPPARISFAPSWTESTASQTLEPTPEWKRWLAISDKELSQATFAEFLEDNSPDVIVPQGEAGKGFPTQQELMSVASTLTMKTDVQFASSVKLQNGQVQVGYVENISGGHGKDGAFTIPERFALGLAPFRGTSKYLVTARLRYKAASGKAIFRVQIERPHKIVESAFNDVRAVIEQSTGLKVLVGKISPQTRPTL